MSKPTRKPPAKSFHRKFITVLLTVALAFVTVAALVGYQLSYERSIKDGQRSLASVARTIHRAAAIGIYTGDKGLLNELLENLQGHEFVKHVAVQNVAGVVLAKRGDATPSDASSASDRQSLRVSERLVSPFDASEHLGQLVFTLDDGALRSAARSDALALVALLVTLVALLVLIMNHIALKHVSVPMRHLVRQLTVLEPGTEATVSVSEAHRTDELGTVTAAVNRLLRANAEALQRERRMRKKVSAIERQYRQIFDVTSAGIFLLTGKGQLITNTPTVAKLLGASEGFMQGLRTSDFVATVFEDEARVRDMIQHATTHRRTVARDLCVRDVHGGRRWVHCLLSVHVRASGVHPMPTQDAAGELSAGLSAEPDERGDAVVIEGVMYDVTRRKHKESVASHRAEHDPLTGLKNRAGIERELSHCLALAHRQGEATSLLFIDLDGFKQVNDDYGHDVGDLVLIECAQRLKRLVREDTDFVGRLGGDEMVLVLNGVAADSDVVTVLASRVVQALSLPVMLVGGREVRLGASVGVAGYPMHAGNATSLIRAADAAMYRVKRDGKNNFSLAEAGMADGADAGEDSPAEPTLSELQAWHDEATTD